MPSPIAIFKYLPRTLRVTQEGRYFILLALITGFAALNTGNNLVYLLAAALLSLIVVSGLLSELSLRKIALTAKGPPHFSAGKPDAIRIYLHNQKKVLPSFSLSVTGLLRPAFPSPPSASRLGDLKATLFHRPSQKLSIFTPAYFMKLPPDGKGSQLLQATFPRRGCYQLEGFKLSTPFPFGLFIKSAARTDPTPLWVYPRIVPVSGGLLSRAAMESASVSDRTGQAAGFNHFREHHDGDDRRQIHWKLSARQGRLIIKEREREEGGEWALFFNHAAPPVRSAAWNNGFERAVEAVASCAAFLLNAGLKVSLQTAGEAVEAGEGPGHLDRLLKALTLLEPAEREAAAVWPNPAAQPAILIRMKEDRLWGGKESLFEAVLTIDPETASDSNLQGEIVLDSGREGRCR
ncbi:MAG TPA: DUF58 domain-containing protein [Candidatus Manganitrophaceae bacterium]|nr:DUF58 domain-containing protein [Candidatus Manganitrophaceae bacterium]